VDIWILPCPAILANVQVWTARCNFDTSTNAVIQLKAAGVGNSVIQQMIECKAAK
jgi:hypothetical protein